MPRSHPRSPPWRGKARYRQSNGLGSRMHDHKNEPRCALDHPDKLALLVIQAIASVVSLPSEACLAYWQERRLQQGPADYCVECIAIFVSE